MALNLEWVDAFVDFADHLNFTHAARFRNISQPALHAQIRRLQESIGSPLYHRKGRNLELSDAGRKIAAFGRELRLRERCLLAELHGPRADAPVVLQAGEGAYLYLLDQAIRRFRSGGGLLQLRVGDAERTRIAIVEGRADIGVSPFCTEIEGIESELIVEVGQMLIVPKTHELASRKRLFVRDLRGLDLVVPPAGRPQRTALEEALRGVDLPLKVAVEATGWALMIHLVRLGVGFAVVNDFCRLPRGFVGIPIPALPRFQYCAFRRRHLPRSNAGARLWALLVGSPSRPA